MRLERRLHFWLKRGRKEKKTELTEIRFSLDNLNMEYVNNFLWKTRDHKLTQEKITTAKGV